MSEIHICAPDGRYIGQTRVRGYRRWRTVTRRHRTALKALCMATRRMTRVDHRLRVLWVGTDPCYYDPRVVIDVVRR